ncbi:MAG: glycosyltransferase [Gemmata sp.]
MTLSVCVLAKNEAHSLPRLLQSVVPLAPTEVLVGDVESGDGTARVAAAGGARVTAVPWQDDFSTARNAVLAQARGDWVLWLNPDEEVVSFSPQQVRAALAMSGVLAYAVRVQAQARADRPDAVSETAELRLFRRRPDVRFVGRLHPQFATPLEALARRESKQVGPLDLAVRTHAYQSTVTPDKLRWAARLLELELKDRPGQLHYRVEYGRTLLRLNDPRGHDVLAEACETMLARRRDERPPPAAGDVLEYALTVSPGQSRLRLSREEACELALHWFPDSPPVLWRVAEYYFQAGNPGLAAGLLDQLVQFGRTGAYDHSAAFDPDIIGPAAVLNLGVCRLRQGALDRAEECFRSLLSDAAHAARARTGLADVQRARPAAPPG